MTGVVGCDPRGGVIWSDRGDGGCDSLPANVGNLREMNFGEVVSKTLVG